jgi:hypothetical protein
MPVSPEEFDRQFTIVVSGAERTRGVLYFFCLVLITGIVFFFEDAFNTTGLRLRIMNGANACLGQTLAPASPVPLSNYESPCKFYYDYVRDNYQINIPKEINVPKAPAADVMDKQAETAFLEKYKAVLRDATDSLSTTVPVLNIKIDRNTGLILQNSMGVTVLFILLISLQAERKSLVTAPEMIGGDYFRAKAILDTHVFSRMSAGQIFLFSAVFLPAAMQGYRVFQDFFRDYDIVMEVYRSFGPLYLACEAGSLAAVLFLGFSCFLEARELAKMLESIEQQAGAVPDA